jgi:hypothetical protein
MAQLTTFLLLDGPPQTSEGEDLLGVRLDQVIVVPGFPATVDLGYFLEVHPEFDDEGDEIFVEVTLLGDEEGFLIGEKSISVAPRGPDSPHSPDVPVRGSISLSVPVASSAYVTVALNGEVVGTKWIRVVRALVP